MNFDPLMLRPDVSAYLVFHPRRRRPRPGWLGEVTKWRARIGMASIVVLTIPYGGPFRIVDDWWNGKMHHLDRRGRPGVDRGALRHRAGAAAPRRRATRPPAAAALALMTA